MRVATFLFEPGLKLDKKFIENGLEGIKDFKLGVFSKDGCHHPNTITPFEISHKNSFVVIFLLNS